MTRHRSMKRTAAVWILVFALISLASALVAPQPDDVVSQVSRIRYFTAVSLEVVSWTAFPLVAWLVSLRLKVIENARENHYSLLWQYTGVLAAFALLCEAPYDFVRTGTWWSPSSQNPVVAIVIALIATIVWKLVRNLSTAMRAVVYTLVVVNSLVAAFAIQTLVGLMLVTLVYALWHNDYVFQWRAVRINHGVAILCTALVSGITPIIGVWIVGQIRRRALRKNMPHAQKKPHDQHVLSPRWRKILDALDAWFIWWAYPVLLLVCALARVILTAYGLV